MLNRKRGEAEKRREEAGEEKGKKQRSRPARGSWWYKKKRLDGDCGGSYTRSRGKAKRCQHVMK
jgi:hypothetical protein